MEDKDIRDTISFSILNPLTSSINLRVRSINIPGEEGELGVLPGHVNLIASLKHGIVRATDILGTVQRYLILEGVAQISSSSVNIVTDFVLDMSDDKSRDLLKSRLETYKLVALNQSNSHAKSLLEQKLLLFQELLSTYF
jgi:F-type H+-transporting ATPase subunit epsilon